MQRTLDFLNFDQPAVVFGFAPPYYPAVRSEEMKDAARFAVYKKALSALQEVEIKTYFPGVSDCSYCGIPEGTQNPVYQVNTPLWGNEYHFAVTAADTVLFVRPLGQGSAPGRGTCQPVQPDGRISCGFAETAPLCMVVAAQK